MKCEVFEIKSCGDDTTGPKKVVQWKKPLTADHVKDLQRLFDEAINNEKNEILLDCKAIPFVDSQGLELLLYTDERLRKRGGALKLAGLNGLFTEILVATRLMNVLRVYNDIQQAMRSTS
jgi:anti-sigma B factor antagonist